MAGVDPPAGGLSGSDCSCSWRQNGCCATPPGPPLPAPPPISCRLAPGPAPPAGVGAPDVDTECDPPCSPSDSAPDGSPKSESVLDGRQRPPCGVGASDANEPSCRLPSAGAWRLLVELVVDTRSRGPELAPVRIAATLAKRTESNN